MPFCCSSINGKKIRCFNFTVFLEANLVILFEECGFEVHLNRGSEDVENVRIVHDFLIDANKSIQIFKLLQKNVASSGQKIAKSDVLLLFNQSIFVTHIPPRQELLPRCSKCKSHRKLFGTHRRLPNVRIFLYDYIAYE